MTTSNATGDDYDELRAEFVRSSAALIRQRATLTKAEEENKKLLKRLLRAGHSAGIAGFRSDVQKIAPFSVPTVRALAEEAGVPPDERYVKAARVRKARERVAPAAAVEVAAHEPEPSAEPPVLPNAELGFTPVAADIAGLPRAHVEKLATAIRASKGAQWVADVLSQYPGEDAALQAYRIVEHARDARLIPERDLYPQEP